jgi:hypothetical protein
VFVPSALLAAVPDERAPEPAAAPRTAESTPATPGGLPKRSRVAVTERPAEPAEPAAGQTGAPDAGDRPPARPARETAAGLGAWQRGTRSGRAATPPDGTDTDSKEPRP